MAPPEEAPLRGPLARLHRRPLEGHRLLLVLGPLNRVGARYFQLWLEGPEGQRGQAPLLTALHHQGPHPAQNWVEVVDLAGEVPLQGVAFRLTPDGEEALLRLLIGLLPPGGHIMVPYEGPRHEETRRALEGGVPPILTPLGLLLHRAGACAGLRDWYIPEGWLEGPRKLQAFRPLDTAHLRRAATAMAGEALRFLGSPEGRRYLQEAGARERARQALALLAEGAPELREALEGALGGLQGEGPSR